MRRLNNKGISPVIATVILVAISIAVAIAVAFWMTGIVGLFTRFEKVEITYIYANKTDSGWKIYLNVTNTGTADTTISNIFINGKPYDQYSGVSLSGISPSTFALSYSLAAGDSVEFAIEIPKGAGFRNGQSIEVKVHTTGGQEYPKLVNLP